MAAAEGLAHAVDEVHVLRQLPAMLQEERQTQRNDQKLGLAHEAARSLADLELRWQPKRIALQQHSLNLPLGWTIWWCCQRRSLCC